MWEPAAQGRLRTPAAIIRGVTARLDISVVIPTLNERANLELLLPDLWRILGSLGLRAEVLVLDGASSDGTREVAERWGARAIAVLRGGYGEATRVGLSESAGEYVVTMDADLSHAPEVVARLWAVRDPLGVGIASRYVRGGTADMSRFRWLLSRALNAAFARGLALPARDLSSGCRSYPAAAVRVLRPRGSDFDVLLELLVRAHTSGWRIVEVPFDYAPRRSGSSKARVVKLGLAYARTFVSLWRLRNSIPGAVK
ncbi:hypothetical protein BH18CHL2_BH18CHL2_06660 [soil metagenome]